MRRFADAAAHRLDQDRIHSSIVVPGDSRLQPLATIGRMSATALGLVLFAALLHAFWNVVAKRTGGDARFALIAPLFLVVLWAPLGLWAAWSALPPWGRLEWAVLFASAVVHVVYFTTLLRGYRLSDSRGLSVARAPADPGDAGALIGSASR